MTRPVNLRQARKQRARDEKRAQGDANAAKYGEAKHARAARRAEDERTGRAHEAHKRDD
ncbi:DUF4169 family protein [Paracoccus methylarcula]|uniref:DUF4169 domain-containing protein n=1 Tax=Paracoccus methylarcula TaxID=72022 RepID=A0A422QY56_9RHOB|nr:DUF4169 family protein [Paracoccus methylarcula]RNF34918.1 DUF4169 domain-containing protein [Paracoccus methylarcula]